MKSILALLALICVSVPASARSPELSLEMRVRMLERQINRLDNRVEELELALGTDRPLPGPMQANCLLIDSYNGRTHLGSGSSQIDAEFNARKACESVVPASSCSGASAKLKCDDTRTTRGGGSGNVCVITDSYNGRTHRGEGNTAVAAEAKARQSCQNVVPASSCSNVPARCEARY